MFTGRINQDTSPELIPAGDLAGAENMSNSTLLLGGAMSALPSSKLLTYVHPNGINKVLGMHEDRQTQSVIVFVYNTLGNHRILRIKDEVVTVVSSNGGIEGGDLLLFDRRIHSVVILDNKLYWVDGYSDETTVQGSEPRSLDIAKSDLNNKLLEYELYAGIAGSGQFALGRTYDFLVFSADGNLSTSYTYTVTNPAFANNPALAMAAIATAINTNLDTNLSAEYCDCRIKITMDEVDFYLAIDTLDPQVLLVPTNHYGNGVQYFHTVMAKRPPKCAPNPSYVSNPDIEYNNVRDIRPQFRSRYIYDDGGASPWSEISIIPLSQGQNFNGIQVDFTEDILSNPFWLSIIRYVEVAYRDGNNGVFRSIRKIPVCEIGTLTNRMIWYNDANYDVVETDDLSLSTTNQVIMNEHNVPRSANAMEAVSDDSGNTRIVLGGVLRGYDCPDCVEATFPVSTNADTCLVDIVGSVDIINSTFPGLSTDNPNFRDYSGGFPVYLAGTRYFAVSNNPADGTGDGSFIIRGVPKGKYSLRVASYRCSYGSPIGGRYDLTNGTEWQKTSSPVLDVAGSVALNGVTSERLIDLSAFVGTTFDLDAQVGFGPIQVRNAHDTSPNEQMVDVYVMDNFGLLGTALERSESIAVENHPVEFHEFSPPGDNYILTIARRTDHNGYAFINEAPPFSNWRVHLPSVDPGAVVGTSTAPSSKLYQGNWTDIVNDTAFDAQDGTGPNLFNYTPFSTQYPSGCPEAYIFVGDPIFSQNLRRSDTTRVVDVNASPVTNALVWMFQHGRPARTNSIGEVTITVFGFNAQNSLGALQNTYCVYELDTCGNFPIPPSGTSGIVLTNFNLPDPMFELQFQGGITIDNRYLKSGGAYKVGILYEDDFQRNCGVVPAQTVYIPFHTEAGVYAPRSFSFSITSKPPIWAKKYRIVRSKDGYYQNYVHMPIADAVYAVINDGYNQPTITGYNAGNATHVMLQIGVNRYDVAGGENLIMFRNNNTDGYRSQVGDRCRFLLDENEEIAVSNAILDYNIVGEYVDGDKYYVIIPFENIGKQIMPKWVFEFYTPRAIEEEIYYGTGVCLPIINAGLSTRQHSGITQDQTDLLPATGPILSGDTYWNFRQYVLYDGQGYQFTSENDKVLPYDLSPTEDIGRPFIVDPFQQENFMYNMIQISGTYVPNSSVNNLSVFGSQDYILLNRSYGHIGKLIEPGSVLLAICEFRTQPIYVSKDKVVDLSTVGIVGRTARLLNIADELVADAGTVNPESVTEQDGRVYWWDLLNATPWMYGPSGVQDIRNDRSMYFMQVAAERRPKQRILDHVVSGFDRKYRQFFLTFLPINDRGAVVPRSTVFVESSNGWVFDFTQHPVDYASVANRMYIGNNSIFHLMYEGSGFLNFFGAQQNGKFSFWANPEPYMEKNWHNIRFFANKKFFVSSVFIPEHPQYPNGMQSRIPIAHFGLREGQQYADFLRDQTDPAFNNITNPVTRSNTSLLRGRFLKGNVIRIELQINTPVSGGFCNFADVSASKSNITR
jgi:hypothetical protein